MSPQSGNSGIFKLVGVSAVATLLIGAAAWRIRNPASQSVRSVGSASSGHITHNGVEIVWQGHPFPVKSYHGPISATSATAEEIARYRPLLERELSLYPRECFKQSKLRRIVVCRGLSFNGQARAAVPDFEHDTLFLDAVAGDYDRRYQRSTIHHDYFHMIDYKDDGSLDSDREWSRLNPGKFQYGKGGAKMQDDPNSGSDWDAPGFLTRYATSAVEEDKAEVFAHLMTDYAAVVERSKSDPVIDRKISAIKALLTRFCPSMNESFWQRVRDQSPPP
jgi:hypothetical protein